MARTFVRMDTILTIIGIVALGAIFIALPKLMKETKHNPESSSGSDAMPPTDSGFG